MKPALKRNVKMSYRTFSLFRSAILISQESRMEVCARGIVLSDPVPG
jgi:hypothetical protein